MKEYLNLLSLATETSILLQRQEDTGNKDDLLTEPNSCLSDFSDSLNALNFHSIQENSFVWFIQLDKVDWF